MKWPIFSVFILFTTITMHSTVAFAEKQPRMNAALMHLQKAQTQLQKASRDKGGHRVKALKNIRQAINQVKKGIAYDNINKAK